ncbi:MAG: hypothetical protein PXX77_10650 [Gallionella sp.]|jgi:excisionase family DNA binding protein|nr:hypothetical protein [Gallionella sp.]
MNQSAKQEASPVEPFVDAREAAYTMNLPMYYLTNATQRKKMGIPFYRLGRMIRFKLSELEGWLSAASSGEGDHA